MDGRVGDWMDDRWVGGWTNRYIYIQVYMYAHLHLINIYSNDVIKILKKIITLHVK